MNTLPIFTVDAFTTTPFTGNPAGVCLVDGSVQLSENQMLKIAKEMRHSETAFLVKDVNFSAITPQYRLRWFTPLVEVNLCGHATLASAHVLWTELTPPLAGDHISFSTRSGCLEVFRTREGITMDFPQGVPESLTLDSKLCQELGNAFNVSGSHIVDLAYCNITKKLTVMFDNVHDIENAKLNAKKLMEIHYPCDVRGVTITTPNVQTSDKYKDYDFISRYFNPWVGIDEDPVNGSGHTVLGVYYQRKLNKNIFKAFIASERTGSMIVEVLNNKRILLKGNAVTVLRGTIAIPK